MSLTTCLKSAAALTAKDRKRITDGVRALRRDGVSADEAARQVVGDLLAEAEAQLESALAMVREEDAPAYGVEEIVAPKTPRVGQKEEVGGFEVRTAKDGTMTVYTADPDAIRELLPDDVRGRVIDDGIVFQGSQAARVRAAIEGKGVAYGRAGAVLGKLPVRNGKYLGAPDAANTPGKIPSWRKMFKDLALEGERGRYWYEKSSSAVLQMVGGNLEDARRFVALLAIYSPQAKVDANSTFAIRAWAQYKAGQPISVKTAVMDKKATDAMRDVDAFWSGEKTGNFYFNLLSKIDPKTKGKQGATIDMWMMRAGTYASDAPTSTQYAFMEHETNRLAKELGWEPQQVQAAVWVDMKARMENKGVKQRTEASSERRKWIRFEQSAKGGKVRVILDDKAHRDNWLKHSFEHAPTAADMSAANFDFGDGLRRHIGQLSWGARPGRSTGVLPGVHDAPYEQQVEFQQAVQRALYDDSGVDLLAQKLGLLVDGPDLLAPGVWQGDIAAGMQKRIVMAPAKGDAGKSGVDPAQKQALETYAAVLGLLLRQEGVGYHRPFYKGSKSRENAVNIDVGRPLTPEEASTLWTAIDTRMQGLGVNNWEDGAGLVSSPNGMRVVNFGAVEDNSSFRQLVADALDEMPFGGHTDHFATDGDLVGNNWMENPDGQVYASRISAAGSSDLLGWAGSVLAPRVQAVFDDFSTRYGWGDPGRTPLIGEGKTGSSGRADEAGQVGPLAVREGGSEYGAREKAGNVAGLSAVEQRAAESVASKRTPPASPPPTGLQGVSQRGLPKRYKLPTFGKAAQAVEVVQDRYNRLKQTLDAVRAQGGSITEANDWYRTEERMRGQMAAMAEDFRADMGRMIEGLAADGLTIEQLEDFSYAMHAKERNDAQRELRAANPVSGFNSWSGMTDKEAAEIKAAAKADGTYDALLKHQKTLQAWIQGTRDMMLAEGLITPAEYQVLSTKYRNYVPLRGKPDDKVADPGQEKAPQGRGTGKGFDIRGQEFKEAKGRYPRAKNIVENIIADRLGTIQRSGKNRVLRSFAEFVRDNPSPNLWEVSSVENKAVFETDEDGNQIVVERPAVDEGEDTIGVKDGGVVIYIKIRDRALLAQMKDLNVEQVNTMLGHMLTANRMLGRLYTSLNPAFTVINGARDVQAATLGMIDEVGFKGSGRFLLNLPKALFESAMAEMGRPSVEYQLYRATGGKTGFMGLRDLETLTKEIQADLKNASRSWYNPVKLGPKALAFIEGVNAVVENSTRFAAFQAAYQGGKGVSVARAASISKNIAVNFNRKGTQHMASAWFLFFNPAVQGTARIAQSLKSPKVLAALGSAMAGSALLAMQNAAMGDDDDGVAWWDKIPDEIKDRNLVIVLPPGIKAGDEVPGSKTGRYIKIPLPYGWNFFHMIATQSVDVWRHSQDPARGRDMAKAATLLAKSAISGYLPMSQVGVGIMGEQKGFVMAAVPDALDPIAQPILNMSPFGRQLFPDQARGEAGMPESQRYFAGQAGTIFQRAAQALNESTRGGKYQPGWADFTPATLEGLVRGYGGGPASFTLDLLNMAYAKQSIKREDLDVRRAPFIKQAYGVIDNETDRVNTFDLQREIDKKVDPYKRAERDAKKGDEEGLAFVLKSIDEGGGLRELGEMNQKVRDRLATIREAELAVIRDKTLSDAEKYRQIQDYAALKRQSFQILTEAHSALVRKEAGATDEAEPAAKLKLPAAGAKVQAEIARALGF